MAKDERARVIEIAERVVAAHGYFLEDVSVRRAGRRLLVQVIIDAIGGVDLDAIANVSRDVDREIEAAAALGEAAYTLEVTSRGVDRPLTLPRHFEANVSRKLKLNLVDGSSDIRRLTGIVGDQLQFEDGSALAIADVQSAVVEIEFNRPGVEAIAFDVTEEVDGE